MVETGFVVGTGPAAATSIEYSLDGGAFQTAAGTTTWSFALPTGGSTWRDGSQHTITVRTLAGSASSITVQIIVRKTVNRDVNGDGYADIAVGATTFNSSGGAAYIFHGSAAGVASVASTSAAATVTGPALSELGNSTALGDLNGDGYADLAVGASTAPAGSGNGAVYVFHGSATGVAGGASTSADTALTGSLHFGAMVAFGDTNNDGYADLAVGSYNGASAAYVFHGSATGVASGTSASADRIITGAVNSFFGSALALGDLNGDSYADLAVVAQSTGNVFVFHGSATGVINGTYSSADANLTGGAIAVALGDVDGDGNTDLAIGNTTANAGSGAVYLFQGSAAGVASGAIASIADATLSGVSTTFFGNALALGDTNSDGYADLAVGAYFSSKVFVFLGTATGLATAASTAATTVISGGTDLGVSVALIDVNGDGHQDLVVGDEMTNSNAGAAHVLHGSATGVANTDFNAGGTPNTTLTGATGSQFGFSVGW